jgi:hypothetical protein
MKLDIFMVELGFFLELCGCDGRVGVELYSRQ